MARLPDSMTAITIDRPGGPEVLRAGTRPVPHPGPGALLVRVEAAGVNRPDVAQREGAYPPPPGASDIPGLEIAGTVVAVGDGLGGARLGERVTGLVTGGGYAEYCVLPQETALPWPAGYDALRAAALPETFFTVWSNLFDRAGLGAGETLLVHGGASGIGTTAIQLGTAFGARVFATAGSTERCAACERLGARRAINYREEDFVAVVKAETEGRGADVILDMVGGDYTARNHDVAAVEGRIVQIAALRGGKAEIDVRKIMVKRLVHTGSTLRPRDLAVKGAIARALRDNVWPLLESGRIAPVIDAVFPLAEAAAAHRRLDEDHVGKVMLHVS